MAQHFTVGYPLPYYDFLNWRAVWVYLSSLGALFDDYDFEQVSTVSQKYPYPGNPMWTYGVDLNGHTVRCYVSEANSHGGDPTKGKITTLGPSDDDNEVDSLGFALNHSTIPGVLEISDLYIKNSYSYEGVTGIYVMPDNNIIKIKNLLLKGDNIDDGGIWYELDDDNKLYMQNCKIWDWGMGLGFYSMAHASTSNTYIENVSVYHNGRNIQIGTGAP